MALLKQFLDQFKAKGWTAHPHQHQIVEKTVLVTRSCWSRQQGQAKPVSFLPGLIDLAQTLFGSDTLFITAQGVGS